MPDTQALPRRWALIFLVLFCVSCSSYSVASRKGQPNESLNNPDNGTSSPGQRCKPLSEGLFVVQAGAFKNISYAKATRKRLEDAGYESYMTVSGFSEDQRIFRVLVGRFTDGKKAQKLAEEIKMKGNAEVIVAMKPPKDKYVAQAGCYSNMEEAIVQRKRLADRGFNAYITLSPSEGGKQFNVLIGEYLGRAEAEKACREIGEKTNIEIFVNTI